MEILIHGTKHGYKSNFIPNSQPSFALGDIRNTDSDENSLGKSAYSISFVKGGCVYTKYTILRDTLRSFATGNIAFSLYLPIGIEFVNKGLDVKTLLDRLSSEYIKDYVRDNNINRGETILIQEDWSFIAKISQEYKEVRKQSNEDEISSGNADPAYFYYKDDAELIKYFDKPYQEEYRDYKQILFIDFNLQGKSNPLNVLKNSGVDLTGNIDLTNEKYYLQNYSNLKGLKITANGKLRSDKKGENCIRSKEPVELYYSNDERCYEPINVSGTISNLSSLIHQYIDLKGNNQILIKNDAFCNLIKKEKIVDFKFQDRDGIQLKGVDIQFGNLPFKNNINTPFEYKFTGDEIIKEFSIVAQKESEYLYSRPYEKILPYSQNETKVLTLYKQKKVKIFALDDNNNEIKNYKIWVNNGKGFQENKKEIIFENDEIDKNWNIEVVKNDVQYSFSGKFENYNPSKGDDPIKIYCKKVANVTKTQERKQGNIKAGSTIILHEGRKNSNSKYLNFSLIAFLLVGIIVLVYIWIFKDNISIEKPLSSNQVITYTEGDAIILDSLEKIKTNWKSQEQDFIIKSSGGWFGGDENVDSTKWKSEWKPSLECIEKAITKRTFVDAKNFVELQKNNIKYSEKQQKFKNVINEVDSDKFEDVKRQLKDLSALTLTQIAQNIEKIILNYTVVAKKEEQVVDQTKVDIDKNKKQEDVKKEDKKDLSNVKTNSTSSGEVVEKKKDPTKSETLNKIKGAELTKDALTKLLENSDVKNDKALKKSIELYLKLWTLDGKPSNSYSSYKTELGNDKILKDSQLATFVREMCNNKPPQYIKEFPTKDTKNKSLSQLKSLLK